MSERILRYEIPMEGKAIDSNGRFTIDMPAFPKVLHVGLRELDGHPSIWAMVDEAAPVVPIPFRIIGTGWLIESDEAKWLEHEGTFQKSGYVWHVFQDRNQ